MRGRGTPEKRRRSVDSRRSGPGRLLDHLSNQALELSGVWQLVLDEADQMLDLGFKDELDAIFAALPAERRTHLVSATFPDAVRELAAAGRGHADDGRSCVANGRSAVRPCAAQ